MAQAVCDLWPGTRTRSARRSTTASTTTSSCRVRSPRPTCRRSRTGCARSSPPTSRSSASSRAGARTVRGPAVQARDHRVARGGRGPRRRDRDRVPRNDRWADLCLGPHVPSTGRLGGAFKLMKLAGAYWRGDEARPMLTGSTARRGRRRTSSTITCIGWRRPRSETTVVWAASSTCSPSPRSSDPVSPSGTHAVVCSESSSRTTSGTCTSERATTSSPRRTSPGVSYGTPRATRPSTRN